MIAGVGDDNCRLFFPTVRLFLFLFLNRMDFMHTKIFSVAYFFRIKAS